MLGPEGAQSSYQEQPNPSKEEAKAPLRPVWEVLGELQGKAPPSPLAVI